MSWEEKKSKLLFWSEWYGFFTWVPELSCIFTIRKQQGDEPLVLDRHTLLTQRGTGCLESELCLHQR